jgi:hypothetical protein
VVAAAPTTCQNGFQTQGGQGREVSRNGTERNGERGRKRAAIVSKDQGSGSRNDVQSKVIWPIHSILPVFIDGRA